MRPSYARRYNNVALGTTRNEDVRNKGHVIVDVRNESQVILNAFFLFKKIIVLEAMPVERKQNHFHLW